MPTIFIDNQPYEVRDGLNLLQACLELGENLPYFCWHPAMGSVGACRQCAIKQFRDENDTRGRIVMACMTPAANNARISLVDKDAREFRTSVIEWMMVNHPHDCPVCDEGSECHLQDMTLMTGHDYRRYRGDKRTFHNQNLGPFVNHEMNRCIQCYRCVRYYRDYAGGKDFNVFSIHDTAYFGRAADGTLESEFSGNLVEVCPTGVFTDKTLKKHYTRKWDLQTAPSICVNCAVGCNTIPGERYGTLRRIRNRYNGDVNGYFLCDRGRYGYEFVNADIRIRAPRITGVEGAITRDQALHHLTTLLNSASPTVSPSPTPPNSPRIIGIGSPRASLESNYALRTLVGPENFYQGIPDAEQRMIAQIIEILQRGPAASPSLHEITTSDAVLVLGEDVSNTAPMIALALRQAVRQQPLKRIAKLRIPEWDDYSTRLAMQNERGPLFLATIAPTRIDDIAAGVVHAAPQDLARLGFAIAHELDASAPDVDGITDFQRNQAKAIAAALKGAERPLVISGTGAGSEAVIQAAASVASALALAFSQGEQKARLSYVVPETNSMGLGLIGGSGLDTAIRAIQNGPAPIVFILENDLTRRSSPAQVDQLYSAAQHVIVLDHLENLTSTRAEIVLPAGTFAESSGTLVNHEGRAQRFYQVFVPAANPAHPPASATENMIVESWRWIKDILTALGRPEASRWSSLDEIDADMAQALPVFKPVLEIAPPADFRIAGQKIAREPARWSGRTANTANINVHEPMPPADPDTPFSYSMEGAHLNPPKQPPPALIPRFWAPGWNSIQSVNKFQEEINGPLRGGNPGCRLIEPANMTTPGGAPEGNTAPASTARAAYFTEIPLAFEPHSGEWMVVPLHHVFGSEELSMLTPGVAERAPKPYLALHPEDLAALTGTAIPVGDAGTPSTPNPVPVTGEGETVILEIARPEGSSGSSGPSTTYILAARLTPGMPRGLVGVPAGLPGLPFSTFPAWGKLTLAPAENSSSAGDTGSSGDAGSAGNAGSKGTDGSTGGKLL